MSRNSKLSRERSNRLVLFADLRDSTDILINFEHKVYGGIQDPDDQEYTYGQFIREVHETTYKELYLAHESTHAEVYGDGVMGVFPEDNTKYILENLYRLTNRMRAYNSAAQVGLSRPRIDMGFGVTLGEAGFVYYPFDDRDHPVGQCIHEAARIESLSNLYDARILISHKFFAFAEGFIRDDPRFSHRFLDRVVLKGFREPVTLFELLMDNDPRFAVKTAAIQAYGEAYAKYCERNWQGAREIFLRIFREYGLGIGGVMADRCTALAGNPPNLNWKGIWSLKDK